ncbi:hypothetical protein BASA50_010284 [Batrachochytrium salamandrivorans]|uniref:Arginine N-methyltransferase 2 n=1 Tax=Batrachochytrium salamandrivorans TaxID=1357716 RepID=A0ABQ8EZ32_9FUNG|nr:hypothetical protein BASA50_010284 [Batrachochytrium salamandrivorans]KAH6600439.1 hypothetical protein BASA61_002286 [Batrachochytrium salamandrivorans]
MSAMHSSTLELISYIAGTSPSDTGCRSHIRAFLDAGADAEVTLKDTTSLLVSSPLPSDGTHQDLTRDDPADTRTTLLHLAASRGNLECVQALLQEARIPWNSVDKNGVSIGEVAKAAGFEVLYDQLVDEGVRTEFLLAVLGQRVVEEGTLLINGADASDTDCNSNVNEAGQDRLESTELDTGAATTQKDKSAAVIPNASYLARKLVFSKGRLLDSDGNAVMMGWEAPLMERHAKAIAPTPGLDVLNIGFGLGIIDEYLQTLNPATHTIIEAHPDVYNHMVAQGWLQKPGVRVLFGRWQDVLADLETYDGIFFDTFGEYYDDLRDFHQVLPNHLREETGVYSFFNGLAGTNQFFHDVSCKMAQLDLAEIGLSTKFIEINVDDLGDDVWKDTKRAYWSLPIYRLPISRLEL